jgi:CO/xanthine dehydrogenase FAD-binding subunit
VVLSRPTTFDEVAESVAGGGQIIAGGTALQPAMNTSCAWSADLVALAAVPEAWALWQPDAGRVRIGAMVPVAELDAYGLAPRWFATPAVRRRATLVGNLVHGSGLRELLPLVLACEGELHWRGVDGMITEPAGSDGPPGSVATAVELSVPAVLLHRRAAVRATLARPICAVTLAEHDGVVRVVTSGTGAPCEVVAGLDSYSDATQFVNAVVASAPGIDAGRLSVLARRVHEDYRRWQCTAHG